MPRIVIIKRRPRIIARSGRDGLIIDAQNDLWLSTVLRSIGDAVIACDASGHIVFMNGVAEQLTGWKQDKAVRHPLSEVFHIVQESTREPVESPVDKVRRMGTVVGLANHTVLLRRDGTEIPIDDSGAPIHDRNGVLTGVVLIFRDITSRRRAERNLELLSDSGRALAESLDFRVTLERIARLCVRTFSDFCYFDLIHSDGTIERTVRLHRDPAQQPILDLALRPPLKRSAKHPVNQAIDSGEPTLIEHVTDKWLKSIAIDDVHLRCTRELRFHTMLAVPVRQGEHNFGTLTFCRTINPAAFDGDDTLIAQELARRVAANLVNTSLYSATLDARERVRLEREKLRSLFLQAPAAILTLSGPEHFVTLANDRYVRLARRKSVTDLTGKRLREALPELEGQGYLRILDGVYQTGDPYFGNEMLCYLENAATGRLDETYFNFVFQPSRNASGDVDGILVFAVEITEQVRARKELEIREQLLERQSSELETIYNTAPIGLALFDPVDFRYLRLNDTQASTIGLPADQILGKTLTEIAPIEGLQEMFQQVAEGTPLQNALLQGELSTQPGVHRYWTVNYSPVFAEDGSVQAITAASLEITAQKLAEQALIQSEKLAAVGKLAASIAHEINNPLEAVTNLIYLAGQHALLPEVRELLKTADEELQRVSSIANQTLRFHKQASKPLDITCSDLFSAVLSLYDRRLVNFNIAVEKRKRADQPIKVYEGDIRQVLNNLFGNAVDAMPNGGRLLIRSRNATDWRTGRKGVVLTVADTGYGIHPSQQSRIFEAFFTTKGFSGTGLGLWISAEIIARHNGRIRIRSSQRQNHSGTVVAIFLPFDATLPNIPSDEVILSEEKSLA